MMRVIVMYKGIFELSIASYPTTNIDDALTQIVSSSPLLYSASQFSGQFAKNKIDGCYSWMVWRTIDWDKMIVWGFPKNLVCDVRRLV